MVLESWIAFDGRTTHVAAALPKTHQMSAKGSVRKAGDEFVVGAEIRRTSVAVQQRSGEENDAPCGMDF
jgi:hypothetical protein